MSLPRRAVPASPCDGRARPELKKVAPNYLVRLASEGPLVDADPQRLIQVLINLLVNACEAVPATGGEITVRVLSRFGEDQASGPFASPIGVV